LYCNHRGKGKAEDVFECCLSANFSVKKQTNPQHCTIFRICWTYSLSDFPFAVAVRTLANIENLLLRS
jgi:hypothetical protein